jgi:hypothetical protein
MLNESQASSFINKLFDGRIVLTVAAVAIGSFVLGALVF